MSKLIPGNQKHLTMEDRVIIEKGLDNGDSFRMIAEQLCKDPSTISKEIKMHRVEKHHSAFNESKNKCAKIKNCNNKNICGTYSARCKSLCRRCPLCNSHCADFEAKSFHCSRLDKAPFVCNNCKNRSSCHLDKSYYRAIRAYRDYRTVLIESRTGLDISEEDLTALDELITPLILQGQSPYVILNNHPEIKLSEKTIYNYVQANALSVKNLDLPKKVKYKVRKSHCSNDSDATGSYEGRTYKDYQKLIQEYPDTKVAEMDTVLGCEGSTKVLLTLHFDHCTLMTSFLLASRESKYVEKVFDDMEKALGSQLFVQVFPLILTDRGSEFAHAEALECGIGNSVRTSIYYCDPMCAWQKPHCEKNHEYIRKICPKGTSFDNMSQADIDLMMSHINSSPRESLAGMTPLAMAKLILPERLLDYFSLTEIPADEVTLTPDLLKR